MNTPVACPDQPTQCLQTLFEAFEQVTDPRRARGIRYPMASVLALCTVAFICGRQSLSGVMRFGHDRPGLLAQLGFPRRRAPSVPTLSRVLGAIEPTQLQQALSRWMSGVVAEACERRGRAVASVDGKASRAAHVHVLNVFLHDVEQVVWQAPVAGKANEISAFKAALGDLLGAYPFLQLIVGDAMFTGEPTCQMLIENGRHYLFAVKADQPQLLEKMGLVFAPQLARPMAAAALDGEKKRRLRRRA